MALTQDRQTRVYGGISHPYDARVAGGTVIYIGALVSFNDDGLLVPVADLADQAGKKIGLAITHANNANGADGDVCAKVIWRGQFVVEAGIITVDDNGKPIHATDDNTLALTSTNDRLVGYLQAVEGSLAIILST